MYIALPCFRCIGSQSALVCLWHLLLSVHGDYGRNLHRSKTELPRRHARVPFSWYSHKGIQFSKGQCIHNSYVLGYYSYVLGYYYSKILEHVPRSWSMFQDLGTCSKILEHVPRSCGCFWILGCFWNFGFYINLGCF